MTVELSALLAAAAALAVAMLAGRQGWLLLAVATYTAAVSWIIQSNMALLLPAFAIAIGLGLVGIVLSMRGELPKRDVTIRHERRKSITNNSQEIENIGQGAY